MEQQQEQQQAFKVFVYGSLMNKQVLYTVLSLADSDTSIERIPQAYIKGFKRCCIRNQVYPGIKRDENSTVVGVLLKNISPKQLEILDAFEDVGREYTRVQTRAFLMSEDMECNDTVHVHCEDNVNVYAMSESFYDMLDDEKDWDVNWHVNNPAGFERFLNMCQLFAQDKGSRIDILPISAVSGTDQPSAE